jgi:hypothetical protein
MEYIGWCQNDFNVQGWLGLELGGAVAERTAGHGREGEDQPAAAVGDRDLGSGRIIASETEAPNMLANLV